MRKALFWLVLPILLAACDAPPVAEAAVSETVSINNTATPAPTQVNAPDLDGESITLYHVCGRSGPFAEFNQSRILAAQDMVALINETGGIFGAQLALELVDSAGDGEVALSAYERIKRLDENILLLLLCDASSELALAEQLSQDGLPALVPGFGDPAYFVAEDSRLYAFNARADEQFALWLDYLVVHWNEIKPPGAGDEIRLALIGWPEEQGGAAASAAAMEYAAGLGVQIVNQSLITPSQDANLYEPVYAARDANSNAIYISARGSAPAELLNALNALGLRERVIVAGPSFAFEHSLAAYLFEPVNAKGAYWTPAISWWTEDDKPAIQLAQELFSASSHAEEMRDGAYLSQLGAVDIARRAFEEAILEVGFEELEANAINTVLSQLSGYSVLEGLYMVNYSGGRHTLDSLRVMVFGERPSELIFLQDFVSIPQLDIDLEE